MFKTRLPFKSHWYLGAGPALILLPADAIRTYRAEGADQRESSAPQKRMMAALLVGLDYKFPSRETFEMLLSLNFVHPVSSPGYSWEEGSSGSIRINRLDLAATLLYKAEWKKR
ncbi:hypothetical protein [Oceanispirochaeta sp.]|jgi:hypothetical protein|uniref:hypothetical protein n=1 Tax=Oceanispirochaeta sp. TaxID=2035350 RepID=UPI00261D9F01|nr:hypothetical protein [Oceanispirochaeta sp.]MDA3958093.1 hypothetical protein [Oceanispirochaeta sp.]